MIILLEPPIYIHFIEWGVSPVIGTGRNLYAYGLSNPARFSDSTGEDADDALAGYAIGVFNGVGMMLNAAFNAESHHDNPMERVELNAPPGVWSDDGMDDADFRAGLKVGKIVGTLGTLFLARTGRRAKSSAFEDLPAVKPRSSEVLASVRTQKLGKDGFGEVAEGSPYLYVVNTANEVLIAPRGLAGRGGTKHTQLSGGDAVKAAGEIMFGAGGKVRLNAQSGRYRSQSPEAVNRVAQELSRSGYETTIQVDPF